MELELPVRWDFISKAIAWYKEHGYTYIEVPWVVPDNITRTTYREGASKWRTGYGDLVGSAEQGFLALLEQGRLRPGVKYVTCTPCFREERDLSTTKHLYFMKVELFRVPIDADGFRDLITDASCCFCFLERSRFRTRMVEVVTAEGLDLEVDGVEVGSYGRRICDLGVYDYGTGIAEPRFSGVVYGACV